MVLEESRVPLSSRPERREPNVGKRRSMTESADWSADVLRAMQARGIATVCTVPDGGLTRFLRMVEADTAMRLVTLSTEPEGIGIATGCWLGGGRAMLAMQSSGVGNSI